MLRLQIKEKQQQLRKIVSDIEHLKDVLLILVTEKYQYSDEELSKHLEEAMQIPGKRKVSSLSSPKPNLGLFQGPKLFISLTFCPPEFKSYSLSCMIDSGCQLNLSRGPAIPPCYWEKPADHGSEIEGTSVSLTGRVEYFPLQITNIPEVLSLYRLDSIKEDCILGSEFLLRVIPFTVDKKKMLFICTLNDRLISCPLSFEANSNCKMILPGPQSKIKVAELYKMEHFIAYAEMHKEKSLDDISAKLIKDCCSESPNAFWKREKYFVNLPFYPLQKINLIKASARLMSSSEREFCAKEIKDLLEKGLIGPSKSPWTCHAFLVNKHSKIKRGKPRLVVNYKPLNSILQKVRYPFPNKASLL